MEVRELLPAAWNVNRYQERVGTALTLPFKLKSCFLFLVSFLKPH